MTLNYPAGPNIIARVLRSGRGWTSQTLKLCSSKDIIRKRKMHPQNGRKILQIIHLLRYLYLGHIRNYFKSIRRQKSQLKIGTGWIEISPKRMNKWPINHKVRVSRPFFHKNILRICLPPILSLFSPYSQMRILRISRSKILKHRAYYYFVGIYLIVHSETFRGERQFITTW